MSRISILVFLIVTSLTTYASANELEDLFYAASDSDGQTLIVNGQLVIIGTDSSDEIEIEFRERSIRVTINDDRTTFRRDDIQPIPYFDEELFRMYVLGHDGDDLIQFVDDFDSDEESFTSSIAQFQIIAMGGTGDDTILNSSVSYTNANLIGGAGRDKIFAGGQGDVLIGGQVDLDMPDIWVVSTTPVPDYEMDDIIAWKDATVVADFWMSIEAPLPSNTFRLAAPKTLPGLPRPPRGPMTREVQVFDSVRLERDNVISYSDSNSMLRVWLDHQGEFDHIEMVD